MMAPNVAAQVMAARRQLARANLRDFACLVDIPTVPLDPKDEDDLSVLKLDRLAPHHSLLVDALQRVEMAADGKSEEEGAIPNLMVLMPPGSAKSTYVDVVFIPWFMARRPRRNVILASYGSDLASKQGKRARKLVASPSYRNLMGTGLQVGNAAVDEWSLENGSEFMSGGLNSGITGNRAHLGVIDDPIKGARDADSKTVRDTVWEAYLNDFCTRLVPGAPQVMILTRWHEDDPAGRILPEGWKGESGWLDCRDGCRWYVICLPARADRPDDPLGRADQEWLWPEYFGAKTGNPEDHWRRYMRYPRTWGSLCQQKPTNAEGTFFKREWFLRYGDGDRPKRLRIYMTSDHAPGGGEANDFNVFRVWGVDSDQHLWMLGGYRVQGTLDTAMGIAFDAGGQQQKLAAVGALPLIKVWKPAVWFPENDNNWKSVKPFVVAAMRRHSVRCRIEELSTAGGDKATKAQAFQAKASMGEVHIPVGTDGDAVIDQYVSFPGGRWDDEVDAAANIGRALDMAHPALLPPIGTPGARSSDYGAGDDGDGGDWRTC